MWEGVLTVTEPVAGSSQRGLLGTGAERECLANDDPSHGSPGAGERSNVHAGADNHDNTDGAATLRVDGSADGSKYQQPSGLPQSTNEKGPATAVLLNNVESVKGAGDVHGTHDELGLDRILDTGRLEDGGSVVEEVVDTGPLLEELDAEAEHSAVERLGDLGVGGEALGPRTLPLALLTVNNLHHLLQIRLDERVCRIVLESTQTRHGSTRTLPVILTSKPARGLGNDEKTDDEGAREDDAESDDDAPRESLVLDLANAVVDAVGDEDADGDHELVRADDGATDLTRCGFGLEHGDTDGNDTETEAGEKTRHGHVHPACLGGDLDSVANDEDEDAVDDALATTEPICGALGLSEIIPSIEDTCRAFLTMHRQEHRSSNRCS